MNALGATLQAMELLKIGNAAEAAVLLRDYTSDVDLDECPRAAYYYGVACSELGQNDEAKRIFRRLSRTNWIEGLTWDQNPFFYLGVIAFEEEDYSLAEEYFTKAMEALPFEDRFFEDRLYLWRGACSHIRGRFADAAEDYAVAIGIKELKPITLKGIDSVEILLMTMAVNKQALLRTMLDFSTTLLDLQPEIFEELSRIRKQSRFPPAGIS